MSRAVFHFFGGIQYAKPSVLHKNTGRNNLTHVTSPHIIRYSTANPTQSNPIFPAGAAEKRRRLLLRRAAFYAEGNQKEIECDHASRAVPVHYGSNRSDLDSHGYGTDVAMPRRKVFRSWKQSTRTQLSP